MGKRELFRGLVMSTNTFPFLLQWVRCRTLQETPWSDEDKYSYLWPLLKSMFTYFIWPLTPNLADRIPNPKILPAKSKGCWFLPLHPPQLKALQKTPLLSVTQPLSRKPGNQRHLIIPLGLPGVRVWDHGGGTWWVPLANGLPKEKQHPGRQGNNVGIQRI